MFCKPFDISPFRRSIWPIYLFFLFITSVITSYFIINKKLQLLGDPYSHVNFCFLKGLYKKIWEQAMVLKGRGWGWYAERPLVCNILDPPPSPWFNSLRLRLLVVRRLSLSPRYRQQWVKMCKQIGYVCASKLKCFVKIQRNKVIYFYYETNCTR